MNTFLTYFRAIWLIGRIGFDAQQRPMTGKYRHSHNLEKGIASHFLRLRHTCTGNMGQKTDFLSASAAQSRRVWSSFCCVMTDAIGNGHEIDGRDHIRAVQRAIFVTPVDIALFLGAPKVSQGRWFI